MDYIEFYKKYIWLYMKCLRELSLTLFKRSLEEQIEFDHELALLDNQIEDFKRKSL